MAETVIPDSHHVVRHCPKNRTIRVNGEVVGVIPRLFELRSHRNETYLSATYLEYFAASQNPLMDCANSTSRAIDNRDCLVVMNVGKTKEIAKTQGAKVKIVHAPNANNPAYAKIKGVPFDPASAILALLADEAATSFHKVKDL